jgi:hypothetical protein
MKMKKYYPILKSRAEYWFSDVFNRQQWAEHVTGVQKSGEYSDIYVRLAWDMAACSQLLRNVAAGLMIATPMIKQYECCYLVKQLTFNDMSKCNL